MDVTTLDQWRAVTADADAQGHLVVVEAQSDLVCMTGLDEEPELHWKADQDAALQPCRSIKHAFQRTARESKDVVFVSVHVGGARGRHGGGGACRADPGAGRLLACVALDRRRRAHLLTVMRQLRAWRQPPCWCAAPRGSASPSPQGALGTR